jgi:hypothetical protein
VSLITIQDVFVDTLPEANGKAGNHNTPADRRVAADTETDDHSDIPNSTWSDRIHRRMRRNILLFGVRYPTRKVPAVVDRARSPFAHGFATETVYAIDREIHFTHQRSNKC